MSYLVLARRLRPQNFDEIVGQEVIVRSLKNAILSGRIPHALLFSGIRGVGKTTTARVFAKALNCVEGPTVTPCGKCPSCKEIALGNSIDVYEIDGASNRGIDEIRELRENVKYSPARDRFKIYIIDEVHMLTPEAFNALLKTLEEPPSHVVFILATTNYHKVPPTIISRCQHYEFQRIPHRLIVSQLKKIASGEKVKISEAGLNTIATAASGSLRDAQSILEQLISFAGESVSDEDITAVLGIVPAEALLSISEAILREDASLLIKTVDDLLNRGYDVQELISELISLFRHLMVAKLVKEAKELIPLPDKELRRIEIQSKEFSLEDILRILNQLANAEQLTRWSTQPRYLLEAVLIRSLRLRKLVPLEEVLSSLSSGGVSSAESPSGRGEKGPSLKMEEEAPPYEEKEGDIEKEADEESPEVADERVKTLLSRLRRERLPLFSMLVNNGVELGVEGDDLVVNYPKGKEPVIDILKTEEKLAYLSELARASGLREIRFSLVQREEEGSSSPGKKFISPKQKVLEDERVRGVLELFEGELIDVREHKEKGRKEEAE
ncbi:MAG: DNA polymerase III subunit gamma/tau [Acidobacteria bacterium]|nr:DNA polymerase III subunit gamma/tau [Acidobacteriota bacterium]